MMDLHYVFLGGLFLGSLGLLNYRNPFSLKNIFIVYAFLIYNVAPLVLSNDQAENYLWSLEFMAVLALFVGGHYAGLRWAKRKIPVTVSTDSSGTEKDHILKVIILILLTINVLFVLYKITVVGVADYYAGKQMVATIEDYGKPNQSGAITQVLSFVLSSLTIVFLAVFVERVAARRRPAASSSNYEVKRRLALRLSFAWFVLFPVVQFSRAALFYGAMTYLALRSKLNKRHSLPRSAFLGALAVAFFIYVGLAREQSLGGQARINSLFISELTPWIAYHDIKANIDQLGYQYGDTLFMPFFLKVVPRGLYPEKQQNSAGYFMTILYPEQFKAGFAIAPTYMGDLYLNFGLWGVYGWTFLFGILSGRVDGIIVHQQYRKIGLFIIVFAGYISLLRDSLSNALFNVAVPLVLYAFVSKWASSRPLPRG